MAKKKTSSRIKQLENNFSKIILQFLQGKHYTPMKIEELYSQLSIPPQHQGVFETTLKLLLKQKKISIQNDLYRIVSSSQRMNLDLITGTISVHPIKGFGFVKTEGSEKNVFIPRHSIKDAVDGDTVEIEVTEISSKGPEGRVIGIVQRSRTQLGCIVTEPSTSGYIAYSPLLGNKKNVYVRASKKTKLKEGDRIICKVTNWNNEDGSVEAELTQTIGHISDPSCDIQAAIEEFELPHEFSKEAIQEAKSFSTTINPKKTLSPSFFQKNDSSKTQASISNYRIDLTKWECVTIDPDTAKDFDDAISLTTDEFGHFHLGVHIADVAAYVKPGSHLDQNAFLRCNSTYFPGYCLPMLPGELSNNLCSLKPNVNRLTISVVCEFDEMGNLIDYKIARTCIKSQKRFTYKEALAVLQGRKKSKFLPLLDRMTQLCNLLKKKRFERGSIDFAVAEGVIKIDPNGVPLSIEHHEYDITHQMIEEFMLKANELVAVHLSKSGKGLIYRIHDEPSPETFEDFYHYARALGFSLPSKPKLSDIQELFQKAKDSALSPQLSVSFIRSMKLAFYSPENIGHYGLALEHYCHFTSPIRRYTDLIIQRLLTNENDPSADLARISEICSEKERLSARAESSVVLLKKLRLAATHYENDPYRHYPATVTRVKPFALFFEIPDFDLESSIHVSELGNDFYEYNPKQLLFRGSRSGKIYNCGAAMKVRIKKIDLVRLSASWEIVR